MQFYMAPMEGLTGYVFRNAYHKNFGDMDKYITPFITNKKMNSKERNDIAPEHNVGMHVVPQVLTNRAEDFCVIAKELEQYGYQTVNLNLGCPSGTVVAKHRGAGFLAVLDELDRFLEEIFDKCPLNISIKTRIGVDDTEEWMQILSIYEKYPLEELMIHPRIQKEFYKNKPHLDAFLEAVKCSCHVLCYNGDIHSKENYEAFLKWLGDSANTSGNTSHKVNSIMLGRGVLKNPGLVGSITEDKRITKKELKTFCEDVLEGYLEVMSGDKNTLFKMKELWYYLGESFTNSEKYLKKIRKVQHIAEYRSIVETLFYEQELTV